jgi:hypothetical protein
MVQATSYASRIATQFSAPVLAPLIASRHPGIALAGAAVLHVGLLFLGLPGWHCPLRYGLGVPCPGCGLSRATVALIHGDWWTSLTYHAFAPFFIIGLTIVFGSVLLPSRPRQRLVLGIERLERHTRISSILLLVFMLYWLARLLIGGDSFFDLIIE